MNTTSVSYTLYDTGVAVEQAVTHLMASPFVLLDCEGRDLGTSGGALSLICIGTSKAETIYLFDVPTLSQGGASITPLFELLRSKEVKKVMWDGRMDFIAILDAFGVGIENVVDLQVAEVVSRGIVRGEEEKQRLRRLASNFFGFQAVKVDPKRFEGIHLAIGMQKCLDQNKLGGGIEKDPEVTAMHKANKTGVWMDRPLSHQLLRYAATDIYLLSILHESFTEKGWLFPAVIDTISSQSQCYISMFQGVDVVEDGVFRPGPLINLRHLHTKPEDLVHVCAGCRCRLAVDVFVTRTRRFGESRRVQRLSRCRVCNLMAGKKGLNPDVDWVDV
ncbi:hypothetical protein JAAARDRAFT_182707 [Jaapia argillacea MUCL 33604]|uniref:3'-5' exonuclease domain-containing protein n=1 Tax=Jaapia argillacea MUCL 33604 TaxID=933084 RepID=A0A067PJD6_9AGAM|nr:hypothetical protein JAAARDRAFT_182707 [Jaapia argillacea MUCL 33604]